MTRTRRWLPALVLAAVWLASVAGAQAQFGNYQWSGLIGKVSDEAGQPLPQITVWIRPNLGGSAKLPAATNKRGEFVYPRIELIPDGYRFGIDSSEWFIREYSFQCRRGTGEIYTEGGSKLNPSNQDAFEVLKHRSHTELTIKLAKLADYQGGAPPSAASGTGAPAASNVPKGEMTVADQAAEAEALGDFAAAAGIWAKALEAKPNDPELMWRRALALARAGETMEAIKLGNRVLAVDPDRKGVRLAMAPWMADAGEADAALLLLRKEQELDPTSAAVARAIFLTMQGTTASDQELEAAANHWLELAPSSPEALISVAGLVAKRGDFEAAEALYRKIAEQDPAHADLMFYNVGVSIINKGSLSSEDRQRAVAAFQKATELNPKNAKAFLQLGYAWLGLGEVAKAKEALQTFLRLAPADPQAREVKDTVLQLP